MSDDNMKLVNINGNNQRQNRVEVSADELTVVECECGGSVFQQAHQIHKLSAVHPKNPTGEPQFMNVPVHICLNCGHVKTNQDLTE